MILSCPACGGQVNFQSSASTFSVCSYCQSTLVRHDKSIEFIGKMAQLPPDMSPVQLGTGGKFNRINFSIIGRKKMAWEHGLWNEWYVLFEDARTGWLAEAQGHWAICFLEPTMVAPLASDLRVGQSYLLGRKSYVLEDVKRAHCSGSMGELPSKALEGSESLTADLAGEDFSFASIDYGPSIPAVYIGTYLEFEDLGFTNLRQIDGW